MVHRIHHFVALESRTVPAAVAPPPGIVSWWTGDDTAADHVGPNSGSLNGGATFDQGMVGSGFAFDGNGYVAAASAGLPTGGSDRTLEVWVNVTAFSSGEAFFAGYGVFGGSDATYHLGTSGDRLFFSSWGPAIVGPPLPAGQWQHVAVTNAGNLVTLYLNGSAVASSNLGINTPPNSPFYIGRIPGPLGDVRRLNGMVDEVSVYNRALTPAEIQGIYAAGGDGKIKNYVSSDNVRVVEGAAGTTAAATFTIRRVGDLSASIAANWATANGTATAGSDYVAAAGQVVFQAGESQRAVTVTVLGDNVLEPDETFQLLLSTAAPGYAAGVGSATILNDDIAVSIDDAVAVEGDDRIGQPAGAFVGRSANGGLDYARAMAWGPDGNLYVSSGNTDQVLRFDGTTGAFLGTFIADVGSPANQGLVFRPDGLYVLSRSDSAVRRFDAATGAFLGVLIPPGSGGLTDARGMTVGPDGNWYVCSATNEILRYGPGGAFLGAFVTAGSGGLNNPLAPTFGPDGRLYVASTETDAVLRYDGQSGAFVGTFVPPNRGGLDNPTAMTFQGGSLFVTSGSTNEVLRYDALTGAFLDRPVPAGPLGSVIPFSLLFDADGGLLVGRREEILRHVPRSQAAFIVRLTSPSAAPVVVNYSTASGSATAGSDFTPVSGSLTFAPGQTTRTILVRSLDDALSEGAETFFLNLSSPVGAAIIDAQAVGTIFDNEPFTPRVGWVGVNGGTGAQRSRVTSITVTFNAAVTFAGPVADAFGLSRIGGGAVGGFTAFAATVNGVTVVTLTDFTGGETQFGSLADGRYALTVRAGLVSSGGQPLDGNGDGVVGDDYVLTGSAANGLYRLYGDGNGDGFVNAADFAQFRPAFGSAAGQSAYLDWLDLDGDGFINAFDFAQFRTRFGASVP